MAGFAIMLSAMTVSASPLVKLPALLVSLALFIVAIIAWDRHNERN